MPKLKVYRTPIGFHDAYVAAPSQKAALAAWGADADLFARGIAEVVDDENLAKAPLAKPGEVIRLPRGTEAQHLKALGRRSSLPTSKVSEATSAKVAQRGQANASPDTALQAAKVAMVRPRPSRGALDAAETAVSDARARHLVDLNSIAERKRALELELRALRQMQADEIERLEDAQKKEGVQFREKLEAWASRA